MNVSVLIPAHNAARTLPELLAALRRQTHPPTEVIVADDRSTDETGAIALQAGALLVPVPPPGGPGVARNAAAAAARGELLLFLDADTLPPSDWIERMVKTFASEGDATVAVWGPYAPPPREASPLEQLQYWDIAWNQEPTPTYVEVLTSANFGVPKAVFEQVGGFPAMDVNEDYVFGSRLARIGRVRFDREIQVRHRFRTRWKDYFLQQRSWAQGIPEMYLKAPRLLVVPQSFRRSRIVLDLLWIGTAILGLLVIPFWPPALLATLAASALWLLSTQEFASYLASQGFSHLPARKFHLVRNLAWLWGLAEGLFVAIPRLWRSRKQAVPPTATR